MKTIVEISNVETKAELFDDFSVEDIRDMFVDHYPVIENCVASERFEEDDFDGEVRYVTFTEKTALKG